MLKKNKKEDNVTLNRPAVRIIERNLFHYLGNKLEYEELRRDIAESCCYALEPTGIRSTGGNNDPTMQKTVKLEKEARELKKWIDVVEAVLKRYKDTLYADFINLVYFKKLNQIKVCELLYISRSTFFKWKDEIIKYTAMLAYKENLINL